MKKLSLLLVVCILFLSASPAIASDTREFMDSTGRKVTIPTQIRSVAVTGPMTQFIVFALAPDLLAGVSTRWDSVAGKYIAPEYLALPVLGQLYGGKGDLNPEELLRVAPDVVIDVGESKKNIAQDMDDLTEKTGIPFVHIEATLETYDEAFSALGDLLGRAPQAEVLAEYCRTAYDRAAALAGKVEKKRAAYIVGTEGVHVIAKGSYHSEVIDLMCDNVAELEAPSSKGTGNEIDLEQLYNWDPEVLFFSHDSMYDVAPAEETWQLLSAISSGKYVKVPYGPQNWVGFHPSCQRMLGLAWISTLLYPEAVEIDLFEETVQYYDLFYHCTLSREAYSELVLEAAFH